MGQKGSEKGSETTPGKGSTGEGLGRVPGQSSWSKKQPLPSRLRAPPPPRVTAEPENLGADGRYKE